MSKSVAALTAAALTAAALGAGAPTAVLAVPASAAGHRLHRPDVQITDVRYDCPGRDDRSRRCLNREWVEIANHSRRAVNPDGWRLEDEDGHPYTGDHYRLGGRATVRIHTGVGRDTRTDLFQGRRHQVWDNRADTATLRNDRGRLLDEVSWGRHRGSRRRHQTGWCRPPGPGPGTPRPHHGAQPLVKGAARRGSGPVRSTVDLRTGSDAC